MSLDYMTPNDPLAGQRVAQALAAGLDMQRGLLGSAAALFEAAARDPREAQLLSRQIADTLRAVASLLPD